VFACFHAAKQSIALAAHCLCVHRQAKKCHNEVVTMDEARKIVDQWILSSTDEDLAILANPSTDAVTLAVEAGRLFAKQAGMATWVLTHNRNKGHAPTSNQVLIHWGNLTVERTATVGTFPRRSGPERARKAMQHSDGGANGLRELAASECESAVLLTHCERSRAKS